MRPSPRTVPGTGLSYLPYVLLLVLSVVLFLFWDGPLWQAKRETSHVMRFAVSYLAVMPAAAVLLFWAKRWSWSHFWAATGSIWAIKLMVTSTLYLGIARGTAHIPVAAPLPPTATAKLVASYEYRPAKGQFARGAVKGSVVQKDVPTPGAVVLVDKPLPGAELADAKAPLRLWLGGGRYSEGVYLGQVDQDLEIENKDPALHTLHLFDRDRAVLNVPVPASEKPKHLTMPEPGIYEARCDTHASERATVVVVDHPYIARADESGQFTLPDVPAGPISLIVVYRDSAKPATSILRRIPARVESQETTVVHIDLSTPEVAEERL